MKWTIPILMLLTLAMSYSKGLIWMEYEVNKEFISRNLCINKSNPKLNCKGKCQVTKQMTESENESPSSPFQKIKLSQDQTTPECSAAIFPPVVDKNKMEQNLFLNQPDYTSPVFPIFH